jgi:DNA-binding NarL/FixJ family response regulator
VLALGVLLAHRRTVTRQVGGRLLLKSRVTDVDEFVETLDRIVKGASVIDPALVQELVAARRVNDPLEDLTPSKARCSR